MFLPCSFRPLVPGVYFLCTLVCLFGAFLILFFCLLIKKKRKKKKEKRKRKKKKEKRKKNKEKTKALLEMTSTNLYSDALSPLVCISTYAPFIVRSCLGHPRLSKFQKMVLHFSTLSSLACEFCQLRKHIHVSFLK